MRFPRPSGSSRGDVTPNSPSSGWLQRNRNAPTADPGLATRPEVNRGSILERYRAARRSATDANNAARLGGRNGAPELSRLRGAGGSPTRSGLGPVDSGSVDRGPSARSARTRADGARDRATTANRNANRGAERERLARRLDRATRLSNEYARGDARARDAVNLGNAVDQVARAGVSIGIGVGVGWGAYGYGWGAYPCNYWNWGGWGCYPGWGWGYGCWGWGWNWCWNWGWNWCYRPSPWYWGGYWCSPGVYWGSTIFYGGGTEIVYVDAQEQVEYFEEEPLEATTGEGAINADIQRIENSGSYTNNRAAGRYLTLGDAAFRDGRYSDAVHFYAKAIEFSADEGVLYLILADALFATGDYHYCAYALRRALELDPTLLDSVVDKHGFYTDPAEFDQQVATLEEYLNDHPSDNDARLVLAANYLFGANPQAAVRLLEADASSTVRQDEAGALLLVVARDRVANPPVLEEQR